MTRKSERRFTMITPLHWRWRTEFDSVWSVENAGQIALRHHCERDYSNWYFVTAASGVTPRFTTSHNAC